MEPHRGQVAWPVRLGMMPALVDGFSARAETAADLAAALMAGAEVVLVPARVAGEAPGGWLDSCGKTQLAVSIAESIWLSGRLQLLMWVDASNRESVLSTFAEAAMTVLGADPDGDGEALAGQFTSWLSRTSKRWLVVLDGLSNAAVMEGHWPGGPAGLVLITSADPSASAIWRGALIHPVGVFSPREALSLLVSRLSGDAGKCQGAESLAAELGYEPLAVAQAGAVIAGSALSCRDYREWFAQKRAKAADAAGRAPPAASITWDISAEHAERLSPTGTWPLMTLAALLDGYGIPAEVLVSSASCEYLAWNNTEARGPDGAREALLALARAGLLVLEPNDAATMVRMTRAVQAAVRSVAPAAVLDRAAASAADALGQAWPGDEQPAWLARSLRSCTASLRKLTGDLLWADGCHPVLLRLGQSLGRAHLTGPAVGYWSELAGVNDRMLGQGHPDTLTARERLASACLAAGRPGDALSGFQWVLGERVRLLGPEHPSAIDARRHVGHALMAAQQFGEAMTVLGRVLSDCERVRGSDHSETLTAREELAAAYHGAGRFADAIEGLRLTLASREDMQGPQHPDTERTRKKLADAYLADGKIKRALPLYKQVLADWERLLGPDHLDTIAIRSLLGSVCYSAGQMGFALQFGERTRAGYARVLGADHLDTLASSTDLARTYYAVGRTTDAITLLRDTLARYERRLPADDPLIEAVRESLASMTGG